MRFVSSYISLALLPINCCLQFGICEYAEAALHPIVQVLNKGVKSTGASINP